jgi:two-component system, OmpR family, sensor histidine kinase AdeS
VRVFPRSLRWQFALAMGLCSVSSVIVVLLGMIGFYLFYEAYFMERASVPMQEALKAMEAGRALTAQQVSELKKYYSLETSPVSDIYPLLFFSGLGILLGALSGALLGARVSKPVEAVAAAAQSISEGKLGARAAMREDGQGETFQLVRNFNAMADGLEEAERELAGSASAIAHELRTPLTILKARLQAIKDGLIKPEDGELEGLLAQTDLLSTIVDDLLDLSLAGVGKLQLKCARINLADEVRLGLKSHELAFLGVNMTLEADLRDGIVMADPARVRQALNALLSNARRYAALGGVVRIETEMHRDFGCLRVLDRGPGFQAAEAELLFDRFWRSESSRTRSMGGAGLGLAVVKAIAEAHGGGVVASARKGGGAVFEVRFPK